MKNNTVKNLSWYPGHMKKALDQISTTLKVVDMAIEIGDARAPVSSLNNLLDKVVSNKKRVLVFSKKDLADLSKLNKFIDYYKNLGREVFVLDLKNKEEVKSLVKFLENTKTTKEERYLRNGLIPPAKRAMVIGIPNVGKSTLINTLANKNKASVANKPGHTRSQQLIKASNKLELIDTPGILQPNYENKTAIMHLAFLGSVKDEAINIDEVYEQLVDFILNNLLKEIYARYKIDSSIILNRENFYLEIAKSRNFVLSNNTFDIIRAEQTVLKEFRAGLLGRVVVDD